MLARGDGAMINIDLLALRLRQYAAAWMIAFLAALIGCVAAGGLLRAPLIAAIDVALLVTFAVLAVLAAAVLVLTLTSKESGATKTAVIVTGLFLLIPLFWAPVLGALAAAALGHVSIEYSTVYAAFRILLAKGVYAAMRLFTQNPVIELGMRLMEIFAAVVGFVAALTQVWEVLGRRGRAMGNG